VKHDRVNYLTVGLFVLAMLVALMVLLAMVTGRTGPTDRYSAVFPNVSGLNLGTDVTYEGFRIGRVEAIDSIPPRDGKRYRVDFSARSGWKIPRNSVAHIFAPGLLAAFTVNIREGDSSEYLEPGGELEGEAYPDMFNAVAGAADEARTLLVRLQETADELNKLLGGENRKHISQSIRHLDETLGHFDRLVVDMDGFLQDNRGGLTRSVADLQLSIGTVAGHVDDISQNLDATSRNLREFTRQLRNNPGVLLRGKPVSAEDMGATP